MDTQFPTAQGTTPVRWSPWIGIVLMLILTLPQTAQSATDSTQRNIPAFWTLDQWISRVPDQRTASRPVDANRVVATVEALCRYYDMPFDRESGISANPSPLGWPLVFADDKYHPRRLRSEFERMAQHNGLATRELVELDTKDLSDTLRYEISADHPVVLNCPLMPILFGYDTREPDSWWWVHKDGETEILFESERRSECTYWADDATANLSWAITGRDTLAPSHAPTERSELYRRWLLTVDQSVQGAKGAGIDPYPLSLRDLRDSIATAQSLPQLKEPLNLDDPLGIRGARRAREYAVSVLEWLSVRAIDTLETQPMRLALYFYHNSAGALDRLDSLLYNHPHRTIPPGRLEEQWADNRRRSQAVSAVTELLEWEKQAAEQLHIVVSNWINDD